VAGVRVSVMYQSCHGQFWLLPATKGACREFTTRRDTECSYGVFSVGFGTTVFSRLQTASMNPARKSP
jgi:hypothetical protein